MKTALVLATVVALGAPAALAGETVKAEFKFQSDRSVEANYEAIQAKANTVCRDAAKRSDTFTRFDTTATVQCKADLVEAAVAALGVTEMSDMHAERKS